jgi:hypothetical protein
MNAVNTALSAVFFLCFSEISAVMVIKTGITPNGFIMAKKEVKKSSAVVKSSWLMIEVVKPAGFDVPAGFRKIY